MRGVLLHLARYGLRLGGVMILESRIYLFRHGSVILRMSHVIRQTRFAVMSLCCAHRTGVHGDARGGHLLLLLDSCCAISWEALYFAMAYEIAKFKSCRIATLLFYEFDTQRSYKYCLICC